MHRAQAKPRGILGSHEEDPERRQPRLMAQDLVWRAGATCRLAPVVRRHIHT
jgi:hypothetical protein